MYTLALFGLNRKCIDGKLISREGDGETPHSILKFRSPNLKEKKTVQGGSCSWFGILSNEVIRIISRVGWRGGCCGSKDEIYGAFGAFETLSTDFTLDPKLKMGRARGTSLELP